MTTTATEDDRLLSLERPLSAVEAAPPAAPVIALAVVRGGVVASFSDHRVLAWRIASDGGLGAAWEIHRGDEPMTHLSVARGELLGAEGSRIMRLVGISPRPAPVELGATVLALAATRGRLCAAVGTEVIVLERFEDGWSIVARAPRPAGFVDDLDLDPSGTRALVVSAPHAVHVIDVRAGRLLHSFAFSASGQENVVDAAARFAPFGEELLVAFSRARIERTSLSGEKVRELPGPSSWCTPLATSSDRRWLASRQSGEGVAVWDLDEDAISLFAELDPADFQAKFEKRARRLPAALEHVAPSVVKVTRWRAPVDAAAMATTVAVGPHAETVAVGDREGRVTVIDGATRRITRSDGVELQGAVIDVVVKLGGGFGIVQAGDEVVRVGADGSVVSVDLTSGARTESPAIDRGDFDGRPEWVTATEIGFVSGHAAAAFDRATGERLWYVSGVLAECSELAFWAGELVALRWDRPSTGMLRSFEPSTKKIRLLGSVDLAACGFSYEVRASRLEGGRLGISGYTDDGDNESWVVDDRASGLVARVPPRGRLLDDGRHVVEAKSSAWVIRALDGAVVAQAKLEEEAFIVRQASVEHGFVVAHQTHSEITGIFTLDGKSLGRFDALGRTRNVFLGPGSIWLHGDDGCLRRIATTRWRRE